MAGNAKLGISAQRGRTPCRTVHLENTVRPLASPYRPAIVTRATTVQVAPPLHNKLSVPSAITALQAQLCRTSVGTAPMRRIRDSRPRGSVPSVIQGGIVMVPGCRLPQGRVMLVCIMGSVGGGEGESE